MLFTVAIFVYFDLNIEQIINHEFANLFPKIERNPLKIVQLRGPNVFLLTDWLGFCFNHKRIHYLKFPWALTYIYIFNTIS